MPAAPASDASTSLPYPIALVFVSIGGAAPGRPPTRLTPTRLAPPAGRLLLLGTALQRRHGSSCGSELLDVWIDHVMPQIVQWELPSEPERAPLDEPMPAPLDEPEPAPLE